MLYFRLLNCSTKLPQSGNLVAPDRYTLKQILQEIETIFALREFLPANMTVPALECPLVGTG